MYDYIGPETASCVILGKGGVNDPSIFKLQIVFGNYGRINQNGIKNKLL